MDAADAAAEALQTLKSALAAAFIGFTISTTLYGISCLQLFMYYRNYTNDSAILKTMAFSLWCLDTLATTLVAHTIYSYLVFNLGNADITFFIPWSYSLQVETIDLTTFITQTFFAWQIFRISRKRSLSILITILAVAAIGLDLDVVVHLFQDPSGATLAEPLVWAAGSTVQGICGVCDLIITITFIASLKSYRTGTQATERLIDTLILYAVSRGIITVIAQLAFFSLNVALPGQVYWLPFQQTVGKLYVNSVLSTLNSRSALPFGRIVTSSGDSPAGQRLTTVVSMVSPISFSANEAAHGRGQAEQDGPDQHPEPDRRQTEAV